MKLSKILITGRPGIGKTTIIREIVRGLQEKGFSVCGFYTEEIRENDKRAGFKIIDLDGSCGILAHVNFKSNYRVGRYFVKLDALEECIEKIGRTSGCEVLIIDEIGKMELFSGKFRDFVDKVLDDDRVVIASVGEKFVEKFVEKSPGNNELIRVNTNNRNSAAKIILDKFN